MSVQNVRVPGGDIALRHCQGGPLDCAGCGYVRFRELPAEHGCGPGHACMQDACARRIERFFHWHPELANEQLAHVCPRRCYRASRSIPIGECAGKSRGAPLAKSWRRCWMTRTKRCARSRGSAGQSGEVANLMTTGQTQRSAGVKHG
ncbi:4Fe4S-binding leucine-rich repeat protein [Paraburkholderia sp. 31.1]|uniref:4Fe4S-binding leucine-rich repeat protein n=1 Tax=Paraburkholderia sp. 31.1 TaxID=2615205 RepID=UPI0022288562|nr:4Fe4S-binding leucine-rich repeat protein [Paraburkholderia sp. 31.1]